MTKNNSIYAILIVISLLLAFGCKPGDDDTQQGPFIGGITGVSLEFSNLAPPTKVNQGQDAPVKVILRNKGEYDLMEGRAKVKIYGVKMDDFGLPTAYKGTTGKLSGVGEFSGEGGKQDIDFGKMNYKQEIVNSQDFDLWAKLCYPYQTKALVDVCMKSVVSEESDEGEICALTGEKVTAESVSAGPVQLTSVVQDTRGNDQVRIDLQIENKGTGNVYSSGAECEALENELTKLENKDKVFVEIARPLGVVCRFASGEDSNKGFVTLDKKIGKLSCWKDVDSSYEDKFGVVLSYTYTETTMKTVTVYEKV
jgi:hypothetical protein